MMRAASSMWAGCEPIWEPSLRVIKMVPLFIQSVSVCRRERERKGGERGWERERERERETWKERGREGGKEGEIREDRVGNKGDA